MKSVMYLGTIQHPYRARKTPFVNEMRRRHLAPSVQSMDSSIRWLSSSILQSSRIDDRDANMNALLIVVNGLLAYLQAGDV